MKKSNMQLMFFLSSTLLTLTAVYIIVGANRELYHLNQDKWITYQRMADFIAIGKSEKIFWAMLGGAINWIIYALWKWYKKGEL